ncbi:hypothetical protein Hdeb2414_s0001g00009961 [Helianthus debilis subsp. tardiflorus]
MTAICGRLPTSAKRVIHPTTPLHASSFYRLIHPAIPPNASNCYHRYSRHHLMHLSLTSTLLRDNAINVGDTTTTKFKAFVRQLGLQQSATPNASVHHQHSSTR